MNPYLDNKERIFSEIRNSEENIKNLRKELSELDNATCTHLTRTGEVITIPGMLNDTLCFICFKEL